MDNSVRWAISPILLLFAGVVLADDPRAQVKPAATPEEAVKQLRAAAQAADYDGFLAVYAKGPRETTKEMWTVIGGYTRALRAVNDAMDEKFGKIAPGAKPAPDVKSLFGSGKRLFAASFANAEILEKKAKDGGKVELKVRSKIEPTLPAGKEIAKNLIPKESTLEWTFTAIKEGGGWKLIPPHWNAKDARQHNQMYRSQQIALERTAAEIKQGKYKTRDEATAAMAQAIIDSAKKSFTAPARDPKQ